VRRVRQALIVLIVLLAVLLVAADRGAAWYATRRLQEKVPAALQTAGGRVDAPTVSIQGVPFLTQVVSGDYDGFTFAARNVGTSGLVASRLDVHATGISWPMSDAFAGRTAAARAATVTATAVIPVASIGAALGARGVRVTVEKDRLRVTAPVDIAGFKGTLSGLADVVVSAGKLSLRLTDVKAIGVNLPQEAADGLARQLTRVAELPRLPYGLSLETVKVTAAGLVATATGHQVALAG
jgi:hypothetical protein